jgi:hypothetical protein
MQVLSSSARACVELYNARASMAVNQATLSGSANVLRCRFSSTGWTGHRMGVLAITARSAWKPARLFAGAPLIRALEPAGQYNGGVKEQFLLQHPLSLAAFAGVSGFMVGAFISRRRPARMLPIHYETWAGSIRPVRGLAMQAVVLSIPRAAVATMRCSGSPDCPRRLSSSRWWDIPEWLPGIFGEVQNLRSWTSLWPNVRCFWSRSADLQSIPDQRGLGRLAQTPKRDSGRQAFLAR